MCLLCAEWQRFDYFSFSRLVYLHHSVLLQIAVLKQPFLVLFRQYGSREPRDTLFVGEDAHHVDTPLHLFVQAFQRVS